MKKIPEGRGKVKPVSIPLPHPLYSVEETEVCLFVKDHKGKLIFLHGRHIVYIDTIITLLIEFFRRRRI